MVDIYFYNLKLKKNQKIISIEIEILNNNYIQVISNKNNQEFKLIIILLLASDYHIRKRKKN